jgi:two-component system, OmpR family, KDP operon response regulator KdpE
VVPAEDTTRGRRVLVIDDEPHILRVLTVSLRARGYRAEAVATGQDGLAAAWRSVPDLVIIDLNLPDMHGVEVIRSLRRWSQMPIIVVSGSTASCDKVDALDAGADDFVSKPFDVAELIARMRAAARRSDRAGTATRVHVGGWTVDLAQRTVTGAPGAVRLTPAEWQLLEVLVRKPGKLIRHDQLLAEVSPRPHEPDSSYLRVHMMHCARSWSRTRRIRAICSPSPAWATALVPEVRMDFVRDSPWPHGRR